MEYTKRRNINRGYMKLEVWQDAIELFKLVKSILSQISNLDLKLKSQILNATQSISSNIAEGYCRRSINEYLYFLNIALGSMGETMTRMVSIRVSEQLKEKEFGNFDEFHYKVENKLLALIKSLQPKRYDKSWNEQIHEPQVQYNPNE